MREDHSFVLKGTENEAVFEGRFSPSGQLLSTSFRNKKFSVETLRLIRTGSSTPTKVSPRQSHLASPGETGGKHVLVPTQTAPLQAGQGGISASDPTSTEKQWQAIKTGLKGFDTNPEVQQAILWGAQQLQVNPNDLAAVIGYESAGTFSPNVENEAARRKGKKGAVGLIQFTPSIGIPALNQFLDTFAGRAKAKQLGIAVTSVTRDDLLKMTPTEQMKFVVLYFSIPINRLAPGDKYDVIYQEILAPGRESEIWYRASDKNRNYVDNSQFDANKDGLITRLEAASEIREQGFVTSYFKQVPVQAQASVAGVSSGNGAQGPLGNSARQPTQHPEVEHVRPQSQPGVLPQDFDNRLTQQLETFTEKFVFPVTVSWQVGRERKSRELMIRTPYFIFSGDMKAEVMANRAKMKATDRQVFNQAPKLATYGKGSPEEMASFTQTLVNMNPFGVSAQNITVELITGWLKKYGIGVDCSGFVTQALDYATTNLVGKDPHLGDAGVREYRNSGSLHGSKGEFKRVNSPAEVKPGDTMWLTGHIRIVTRVGPGPGGRGIQMMVAESTPNAQLPASLAQGGVYRIGVDKAIWWFPETDRFTWSGVKKKVSGYNWGVQQDDKWKTPNTLSQETFYFSRYQPLEAGRKK
ncbi:hypothetical protein [Deinococcus deserti]|uniref:hypothetical protein n=1 Tax=Deinococcus deserti TaxID=310783 RepID=UPI00139226A6|nr:hypothetical protein [Deinococcus deserti]